MAAPGEKSFRVLVYHTSKSVVTVQHAFRAKYAKDPPTDKTIRAWYKQLSVQAESTHVDACVWRELEYRIDVCRVVRGAHTEHI